jgi:ABC-type dipeptide/oligopeptide/nickel transport system permease component/ABC-type transport system substrate-binding protein
MKKYGRFVGLFALTAIGFAGILVFWALMLRPQLSRSAVVYPTEKIQFARQLRDVSFNADNPPVVQRDVDYTRGKAAPWSPKGESPIVAELVKEKKLPPVAERVGPEPLVMEGVEGVGKYGGTWLRLANSASDISTISWRLSGATLVRWSPMGYPIRPHLAKGWTSSPDRREWTIQLRRGVRWSDGAPFTADDILYWWQAEQLKIAATPIDWMRVGGETGNIVKVDDYTVKFIFPKPNATLLEALARAPIGSPRHYLQKYHPDLGNKKLIEAAMSARGLTTARALYSSLGDFRNPQHPRMWPWVYQSYKASPPETFVRNPYFWAVDTEGNQLPYLDRILFEVKSPQIIPIAAASGDATLQDRHIAYDSYTLLMEGRQRNGYEVYHWFPASRSAFTLWPNVNRLVLPNDPVSRQKAALLGNRSFRQALSLAINRQQVIQAIYNGYGEPAQIDPGRESDFHSKKLMKSFTAFDPQRANALLDEVGLAKRDFEGMRTFPDGKRMTWYIDFTDFTGEGPVQFVVDDWAKVGIRAIQRNRSRPLFSTEKAALLHDFTVWTGESEFNPLVESRSFVPVNSESHFAPAYGIWYQKSGLYGDPKALNGGQAPPPGSPIRRSQILVEKMKQAPERSQQIALFQQIADIAAENVWSISIATPPPQLAVVKNGFRNVPRNVIYGYAYNTPANAGIETFYFDKPKDSPGAIAQIKREIVTITPQPDAVNADTLKVENTGNALSRLVSTLIYGVLALGMVLVALRHPYIGRRLLLMVPTLLIISIVTFAIIQMPPGDFVQTRITELRATGDEAAIEEVQRLSESFHLDEPGWKQYMRWMGIYWFASFDEADKGLLQGQMGRSMETQKPVNDIVGDRVMLTFLVSLGTILFTWAVALPIGIYSAVKQYSWGDYILTFIGFIGMCVPNFLLAIILMYWSGKYLGVNVTGLFSPEYAAAPEWTWGKFIDLLQHIWVPVVVIATAGTAGMIRVMRGNLLDELRKPYVTTAMAKGVRPVRLLMKYPVRLALNPFISGVGGIFPQLVSGGAIVAIVLSLPMVGPLMLQGLMTQDVYLAGSMLMVLSLLGIFGTLVSDLLLLWLDPRIRLEGGSR